MSRGKSAAFFMAGIMKEAADFPFAHPTVEVVEWEGRHQLHFFGRKMVMTNLVTSTWGWLDGNGQFS